MKNNYKKGDYVYYLQIENSLSNSSFKKLKVLDRKENNFYECVDDNRTLLFIHVSQLYSTVDDLKINLDKIYLSKKSNLEKRYKKMKNDIDNEFKKEIKLEQRELKLKRIIGDDEDTRDKNKD